MNINVIIGIIMILSFLGMVWYCVKGFNLMVGFAIMATFWTALALVGNAFSPTSAMEGKTFIQVLEYMYMRRVLPDMQSPFWSMYSSEHSSAGSWWTPA
ncbi:MAG: hypothetical protein ACLTW9_20805 [Enterocloster sp.]